MMTTVKSHAFMPYRYALSMTLLIVVCAMLVMGGVYFKSYELLTAAVKSRLQSERYLLEHVPQTITTFSQTHQKTQIFSIDVTTTKKLPPRLRRSVTTLSHQEIQALNWQRYGITANTLVTVIDAQPQDIVIAASIKYHPLLMTLVMSLWYFLVIVFVIVWAYGYWIHAKHRQRIARIDALAQEIMNGDINKRINIRTRRNDEYTQLATTLNAMLDKMTTLMADLRQVNNNIAHDLKTPLNRLRSRLEVSLLQARTSEEYQTTLIESIDDVDQLLATFNALLLLANLDSKSREIKFVQTNVSEVIHNVVELYQALAEDKHHDLSLAIETDVVLSINKNLFAQAISNILDNAIKYTPNGGQVGVRFYTHNNMAYLVISDSGPGIPASQRGWVFERFSRLDQSRQLPGTGLGMALVKAIIEIHHGHILLHDNAPGLRVEIRLRYDQGSVPIIQ